MFVEHESKNSESDCIKAFENGNKTTAELLLPNLQSPVSVTTSFSVRGNKVSNVSLLHIAAYNGWKDIASLLVERYHCDNTIKDKNGHVPLHYAAYNGHLEVVEYFLKEMHCNPMEKNNHGSTPLHYACINNHAHVVQYLLSSVRVDPTIRDNNGYTPEDIAHHQKSTSILNLFQSFYKCKEEFPVHKYTKLILTGCNGAWQNHHISTHSSLS